MSNHDLLILFLLMGMGGLGIGILLARSPLYRIHLRLPNLSFGSIEVFLGSLPPEAPPLQPRPKRPKRANAALPSRSRDKPDHG